jgi:hypothetical protein
VLDQLDSALAPPRAELLHVLTLPDLERAEIGEFWGYPQSRAFAGLLIDCEDDRALRVASAVRPDPKRPERGCPMGVCGVEGRAMFVPNDGAPRPPPFELAKRP